MNWTAFLVNVEYFLLYYDASTEGALLQNKKKTKATADCFVLIILINYFGPSV